jgi:hypothetical protein
MIRMIESTPIVLPSTTAGWEIRLVDHFLRVGSDGDSSPIRSFEITPDTLAFASKVDGATPGAAEAAFKASICQDANLWRALKEGRCPPATELTPSCFSYLSMTLLIDTLLEGEYSSQGQFRDRLRVWLGTTRRISQLAGVATMWRALATWLDIRADGGEPFRRLVLPPPKTWTQIGYTRRLSFPTRTDVRFLDRVMTGIGRSIWKPSDLIRVIEAAINQGGASWGMESAFQEFRKSFRAGTASTEHRFWRLLLRSVKTRDQVERIEAVVELEFDEDGRCSILLGRADEDTELSVINDLGTVMRSKLVTESINLAVSATRGVMFFRQAGMGRWRAQSNQPLSGLKAVHLAFSENHANRLRGTLSAFAQSGGWHLTLKPISSRAANDLVKRLQLVHEGGNQFLEVALVDGVRVGGSWLGRTPFLPKIEAGDRLTDVRRLAGQEQGAQIAFSKGMLISHETIDGKYELSVRAAADESPAWSRHVSFVADAVPHLALLGTAYEETLVSEWLSSEVSHDQITEPRELTWSQEPPASADLLEAIYASGPSGLSEVKVLDLVGRGADGKVEPWSLLRSIEESGFLQSRRRSLWRGRLWTLGELTLTPVDALSLVVEGALCSALETEFREVVIGLGGKTFRHLGASTWTPAVIGATNVDPNALAARLGWRISCVLKPRLRPISLETSELRAEHHVLASSWDWNRRHFVAGSVGASDVSLTRWVHPTGRDHDVYRVKSSGHSSSHMTRNAAILTAHLVARTPLLRVDGDHLVRTSCDGSLPLEFARWLRLVTLSGGGPLSGGGYGYPLTRREATRIAQALPGCTEGTIEGTLVKSKTEILLAARRSGGKTRPRWVNGAMVAAH